MATKKIRIYMCEGVEIGLEGCPTEVLVAILIMDDYQIIETIITEDIEPNDLRVAIGEEIVRRFKT